MAEHPYALRIPRNLRSLLEIEAAKHKQSLASYIVGACWAQLERHSTPWSIDAVVAARKGDLVAVPIFPNAKPSDEGFGLAQLRAFRSDTRAPELTATGLEPAPTCMSCDGTMVEGQGKSAGRWACQDVSCPRYGIEVKR